MKKSQYPFYAILILTFFSMLCLNLLSPLVADDYRYLYSFATQEKITSIPEIVSSMALHAKLLNGRVIPHFFAQLFLMLPSPFFKVINACAYVLLLLGIYRLASDPRKAYDWKLLLAIAGAVFLLPPIFGQTYLWQTGAISYLWRDALMVWVFVPFADAVFRNKPVRGVGKTLLLAAASLYICNSTENGAVSILLMMLLCIAWLFLRRQKVPVPLFVAFAFGMLGLATLFLVPSSFNNFQASASGLNQIFENYQKALSMWLSHALWPSVIYILLFFLAAQGPSPNRDRLAFSLGCFLASLACNFSMASAFYYPLRAMVLCVNLIILASAIVLSEISPSCREWMLRVLAASLGMVLLFQTVSALPNAYGLYRLSEARLTEILAQRDAGAKEITTFGIIGRSRYDVFYDLHDLTDDPGYFPNVYFAKCYGLQTVVVDRFEK